MSAEIFTHDPQGNGPVFSDQVIRQADGAVINYRGGLFCLFKPFRNLRLWMADIPVHIPRIRNKNDERLNRRPAFKLENLLHGIGVCRIAADAPYGIGGIYDRASAAEDVKALNNVGFEIQ